MEPLYHRITKRQLDAISTGTGSYIFAGAAGSGRTLAALTLAERLNCPTRKPDNCLICLNIRRGSFPDLRHLHPDGTVGIEDIASLQAALSQRPFSSGTTRIVIINANFGITREAQNRLLKTLEEPPAQTIIILIVGEAESLLPTVVSRCRVINFVALTASDIQGYLTAQLSPGEAEAIMRLAPSSIGTALTLAADADMRQTFETELAVARTFLSAGRFQRLRLAQTFKQRSRASFMIAIMARISSQTHQPVSAFAAYERAEASLAANVGPRTVMEALALVL